MDTVENSVWDKDYTRVLELVRGDRLCGLVVRVSGYRSRGPGFLERGPLSLVNTIEKLLEGLENRD
jgi:hypothetical protein